MQPTVLAGPLQFSPVDIALAARWGVAYLVRSTRRPEDGPVPRATGSAPEGWER